MKFIIIFITITVLFYLSNIFMKRFFIEKFNNINVNIGNYLVLYFYQMGKTFLSGNDFYYVKKNVEFIKNLPSYVPLNIKIYEELIENKFTVAELVAEEKEIITVAMWTIINKRREKFWLIMKPLINEILEFALTSSNLKKKVEYPVIHFRCSDTPFIKNGYYFFQKYKFFTDALSEIKKKNEIDYKKVILLSCNFHKSNDKNSDSCNIYAESLKEYLEKNGYETIVQCETNIEDFATIFYAPAIISTCSSFSFIAGFFSNGIFISEGHYNCNDDNSKKCIDCGDWLKYGYSVPHKDIKDYYDTYNVIEILSDFQQVVS